MEIKERVLSALKTSYAKYGFKKEELNKLTELVSRTLTDESTDEDVSNAISGAEPYAEMMQSIGNRYATEVKDKYKDYIPKPKEEPKPTPTPTELTVEAVTKMIQEAQAGNQKAISEAVEKALAPYKEREESQRLNNLLQGNEKLKDIPEVFRNNYRLDREENLDATVSKIASDWAMTKQALVQSGAFVEAPVHSTPESDADDFVKMMDGFAERNKPAEEHAQKTE